MTAHRLRIALLALAAFVAAWALGPSLAHAAAWTQPEDRLAQDIDARLHSRVPYNDEWQKKGFADLNHQQDPRQVGPSANWFAMAQAVGCDVRSPGYCDFYLKVLRVPNDSGQGETATDDGHHMLRVYGLYLGRWSAHRQNRADLEAELDTEILQQWALELLTDRYDPGTAPTQHQFITAGQRPVAPDDGAGRMEYLWARGAKVPHSKMPTRWQAQADRVYDHQGPFNLHRFADVVQGDLERDHDRLLAAWQQSSWAGIGSFVKTGSRCQLTFLRFPANGYVSTLAQSCGLPAPRWVAMSNSQAQVLATQFPDEWSPRQPRAGGSSLDLTARMVHATDAIHGKFDKAFPAGDALYGIKLDGGGVSVFIGAPPPPVIPPTEPTPPPVKPPSTGCGSLGPELLILPILDRLRRRRAAA